MQCVGSVTDRLTLYVSIISERVLVSYSGTSTVFVVYISIYGSTALVDLGCFSVS
jgi:hypothetical protein